MTINSRNKLEEGSKQDAKQRVYRNSVEVEGHVDYNKLMALFGTQPIDEVILARFKKLTGSTPLMLRRQVFFSHRDLNWILDQYEAGEKFVLYTGRGPSGRRISVI